VILGIDISRLRGPRTGVGRYLERLLAGWATLPLPFDQIRLFSPAVVAGLPSDERFRVEILPASAGGIWWQSVRLGPAARGVDLFFAPYTLPPGLRSRTVLANLGILSGPHAVGGLQARGRYLHARWSARRADMVLVHSETTRQDLERYYRVKPQALRLVHLGVDARFRPARPDESHELGDEIERIVGPVSRYLLFVGKISGRRHLPSLVEALALLRSEQDDLSLIVVGPNTDKLQLEELLAGHDLQDAVRYFEFLDHDQLAPLYRGASAFVLPTIQEGFSATILEALASGCPVVTVDHAALDEKRVRSAVVTVDTPDPEALREAVNRVLDNSRLRAELRARGLEIAALFSWDATAGETIRILGEVAGAA
jgi:glycosyltransferase involved in cell wall biosynthesis